MGISGETVVVGAESDDDAGTSSGSAYVFTRSGTTWSQQAKLTASDGAFPDVFGGSVAISGETVVAGAYQDSDAGDSSGSAYVFTRSGTAWSEQAKLTASDAAARDEFSRGQFGEGVAINGETVVVGAWQDDDKGSDSGSAYVFARSGTAWNQQAKVAAAAISFTEDSFGDRVFDTGSRFGGSVAVSGETVVAGAIGDNDRGKDAGAAHVFAGLPSKLAFTVQPSDFAAGGQVSPFVKVAVQDASGNTVTLATTSVTVALGTVPTTGAKLSGTTTVEVSNGVATFSLLSIDRGGQRVYADRIGGGTHRRHQRSPGAQRHGMGPYWDGRAVRCIGAVGGEAADASPSPRLKGQ